MKLPWWLPVGPAPEVSVQTLWQWMQEGRPVQIVDARTALEYRQGTVGKAEHAPVTDLPGSLERLKLDPKRPVVVLCLSGHRSLPGTRLLCERGFDAYSLSGGVGSWQRSGKPLRKP